VDLVEALLEGLPGLYRNVLELRLSGCGVVEVAKQLGVSRQTVYRMLELLQERLQDHLLAGPD
jgi:DNA-directed RNA polymerase specialized sigma24 family protein